VTRAVVERYLLLGLQIGRSEVGIIEDCYGVG
jgi:hypothetical protein